MRQWMNDMQKLAEVKDAELLETVELIKELEAKIKAPLEERLACLCGARRQAA